MCACFLAAELLRVVCFHRLHSLSLPLRAGPSAPGPALGPFSGSANSLAGGSTASRAPRPPDPQLRTPDTRVQRLPVSGGQGQLRRVLPRPPHLTWWQLRRRPGAQASAGGGSHAARPGQAGTKSCGLHLLNLVRTSAFSPPPRLLSQPLSCVDYYWLPRPTTFPVPLFYFIQRVKCVI